MYYRLAPSILSADFTILGEQIREVEKAGAEMLHIDVMDGMFVPQISYGMPVIRSIRRATKLPFDVHLMVREPIRFLKDFKDCGADLVTVHAEACTHLHTTLQEIRRLGMKAGVALNPGTSPECLRYVLKDLDYVLVMTVNPGFGGQSFLPGMLDKIRALRNMMQELGVQADIEVDGGITLETIDLVMDAGANWFVAGTAVFKGEISKNAKEFHSIFDKRKA